MVWGYIVVLMRLPIEDPPKRHETTQELSKEDEAATVRAKRSRRT